MAAVCLQNTVYNTIYETVWHKIASVVHTQQQNELWHLSTCSHICIGSLATFSLLPSSVYICCSKDFAQCRVPCCEKRKLHICCFHEFFIQCRFVFTNHDKTLVKTDKLIVLHILMFNL